MSVNKEMIYVYFELCLLDSVCYVSSVSAVFTGDSEIYHNVKD